MKNEDKIKELELEVARLKGVIEGMRTANPYYLYPPAPIQPVIRPYPYWYQTYCTTNPATVATTGYLATGTN